MTVKMIQRRGQSNSSSYDKSMQEHVDRVLMPPPPDFIPRLKKVSSCLSRGGGNDKQEDEQREGGDLLLKDFLSQIDELEKQQGGGEDSALPPPPATTTTTYSSSTVTSSGTTSTGSSGSSSSAGTSSSSSSSGFDDHIASSGVNRSVGGASGWMEVLDPITNYTYYWNVYTNETNWRPDASTAAAITSTTTISSTPSTSLHLSSVGSTITGSSSNTGGGVVVGGCSNTFIPIHKMQTFERKLREFLRQIQHIQNSSCEFQPTEEQQQQESSGEVCPSYLVQQWQQARTMPSGDSSREQPNAGMKLNCTKTEDDDDELLADIVDFNSKWTTRDKQKQDDDSGDASVACEIQQLILITWDLLRKLPVAPDDHWKERLESQLETRTSDWVAGELRGSYFLERLKETAIAVQQQALTSVDLLSLASTPSPQLAPSSAPSTDHRFDQQQHHQPRRPAVCHIPC
eukprot:GHVS01037482.1.p1 GENE.GHVS01037482.1~~GHVS01037482.1.p1  ORF type:complete len:459 (-),score=153.24 GHVS01037482.1:2522-3898(-)